MKCVCGNKLREIRTEMDFFEGKLIMRDVKAFYCSKCKEELFESKEGNRVFDEISKTGTRYSFETRKRIAKVGNSFAIPVSKEIADYMQIKKGEEIIVRVKDQKRLVIEVQ